MADSHLTVDVDHSQFGEGIVVARLTGEIDAATASVLEGEIQALIFTGAPRRLVLDFAGVDFMDSSGLRVVIDVHRTMRERDAVLVLENVPLATRRLLEVTGLTGHLDIH